MQDRNHEAFERNSPIAYIKKDESVMKMASTSATVSCLSLLRGHDEPQMQARPFCSPHHDLSSSPIHVSKVLSPRYQRTEGSELTRHGSANSNSALPNYINQKSSSSKMQKHSSNSQESKEIETSRLRNNFQTMLKHMPPPAPPALLRTLGRKDNCGLGKIKVILRVSPLSATNDASSSVLSVDARKKQVTVLDPACCGFITPEERKVGVAAPKMFAFDAVFTQDDSQTELCSGALVEVIQAVLNGTDSCLFSYGNSKLGKTYTMIGTNESPQTLGVIPCAIAWLYKLINEEKQRSGARFSVRVSAVELAGKDEVLRDLLADYANGTENSGISPGIYLREDPIFGMQLQNQSELRAPTVEKAAFYLDSAIENRTGGMSDETGEASHLLFTLHVYQYRVDKSGKGAVAGGRSRLHLLDLSSFEKPGKRPSLSLSAIANIILCIFNGQKHIPYKDCKLTNLLREVLGSISCRAAMIAHVSAAAEHYSETLATIQFASRIHRLRRKKLRYCNLNSGENSCEENKFKTWFGGERTRPRISDNEYTSSSEQSCDTVIYLGPNGLPLSDKELTDNEGPPPLISTARKCNLSSKSETILLNCTQSQNRVTDKSFTKPTRIPNGTMNMGTSLLGKSNQKVNVGLYERSKAEFQRAFRDKVQSNLESEKLRQVTGSYSQLLSGKIYNSSGSVNGVVGSDEQWIDRPRVKKAWLEAQNLLPKEEKWVDGPKLFYGYMDQYKHDMIQRWVELQSSELMQQPTSQAGEVWIDGNLSLENNLFLQMYEESKKQTVVPKVEVQTMTEAQSKASQPKRLLDVISEDSESIKECGCKSGRAETVCSCCDSRSDNVISRVETVHLNKEIVHLNVELPVTTKASLTPSCLPEPEIIAVQEPVMKDSSLQVNEEDILAAQFEPIIDHPLRILSEEDLASSFSDTFSCSVDSDNLSQMHDDVKNQNQLETLLEDGSLDHPLYCDVSVSCRSDFNDESIYSCSICSCDLDHYVSGNMQTNILSFARDGSSSCKCCSRNAATMTTKQGCCESLCDSDFVLLRHPDGASNPNLKDLNDVNLDSRVCPNFYRNEVHRSPGNGASSSDLEEGRKDLTSQKPRNDKNCSSYSTKMKSPAFLVCDITNQAIEIGNKSKEIKQSIVKPLIPKTSHTSFIPVLSGRASVVHPNVLNKPIAESQQEFRSNHTKVPTKIPMLNSKQSASNMFTKKCRSFTDEQCKPWSNNIKAIEFQIPPMQAKESVQTFTHISDESLSKKNSKNVDLLQQTSGASSGYESMLRGSEESISSISVNEIVTDSSEDEKHELLPTTLPNLDSLEIKIYDEDDVERLEKRRMMEKTYTLRKNQQQVRELRIRQNELRKELAYAKNNLMIASDCWSFDLHVEESLDVQDPAFLEVLERETQILEKRVTACKSRIMMVTCFDSVVSVAE